MKNSLLILFTAIFILSCKQNSKNSQNESSESQSNTENTASFDWLTGNWKRSNEEAGKETYENWTKLSPTEYSGTGFTMQKGDTINKEIMKLVNSNGKWSLLVKTLKEKNFIAFKVTELKNNEFTSVNDSLDFPKRIQYWSEGKQLKAMVSNDKMKIPFEFEQAK